MPFQKGAPGRPKGALGKPGKFREKLGEFFEKPETIDRIYEMANSDPKMMIELLRQFIGSPRTSVDFSGTVDVRQELLSALTRRLESREDVEKQLAPRGEGEAPENGF